jgi:two-component system sensor histidine kinase VanS
MTIRARLTVTYAGLLTVAGGVMLALVYVFMRFVPTYAIASTVAVRSGGVRANGTAAEPTVAPGPSSAPVVDSADTAFQLTSATDILDTLLLVSVLVLVVLAVAGSIAGWVIAGRVLRPLQEINHAAHLASTGALDHRVGLTGPRDEVRDLSETFDDMLDTLERSFQAHQRFTANASHELKTPIATIQTLLDVALADPQLSLDQLRVAAERVRSTNRRSAQTVDALLDLAEIGYRSGPGEVVDLGKLAIGARESQSADVDRRALTVVAELEPVEVVGDSMLLRQAVLNLVQNAVRHNHDGGIVQLDSSYTDDGFAQVVVSNTGPVVPADVIPSLTEPFVRANSRVGVDGTGLGLAIVKSVAEAHHGTVTIRAKDGGGLTVTLKIPRTASSAKQRGPVRALVGR